MHFYLSNQEQPWFGPPVSEKAHVLGISKWCVATQLQKLFLQFMMFATYCNNLI
jgi:hypothetical protein